MRCVKGKMMSAIRFNEALGRYEQDYDGHIVYANIRTVDGIVYIDYVEAPPALRGTGAAARFMADLMEALRLEGVKVHPICGYAASWLRKHKDMYGDMLAP